VLGGSALLRTAGYLTEWAAQRRSPDVDRPLGFQDAYLFDAATAQRQLTHSFDRALDRAVFRIVLVRALEIPAADRPWLARLLEQDPAAAIDEALIDHTLDAWYRAPPLADEDLRLTLLRTGTLEQLAATKDPFLAAVLRVWPAVQDAEHRRRAVAGERALLEPAYGEAVQAVLGRSVAPDANSSLRITYGTVRSFKPGSSDPADRPFTVASQIAAKNTGVSPFNAPAGLLSAIRARRFGRYADPALGGDLPIDFLSDLDISGGNSGSPVINRRGELVGVLFDSAEQGVLSDISYDPATSRSISVDVRYLAWTLDVLAGGGGLLAEMGIAPTHE
jgi:hypothetical protein